MSTPRFEVWCNPTARNTHAKPRKVGGPYENRDDAVEAKWFDEHAEPAPDKHDYYHWVIVEVS